MPTLKPEARSLKPSSEKVSSGNLQDLNSNANPEA
jgi:hypothetical protein